MKIYIIAVTSADRDTPEVVDAIDEYTLNQRYTSLEDLMQEHKIKTGADDVRVGIIHVPDAFVPNLFKTLETFGVVK